VFLALFLTPLVRILAKKVNAVDVPDERRVNQALMPTMGGLAIYIVFFISTYFLLGAIFDGAYRNYVLPFLLAAGVIVVTGIIDDTKNIKPKQKTLGILIAAIIAYWFIPARFDRFTIPGFETIHFPLVFSFFLTILWIFALTNAINLIDGLDGLASGVSIISLITMGIVAHFFLEQENLFISLTIFALVASVAGFFPYNYHPATIYLGDTGALFLGFMISVLSLQGLKNATLVGTLTPLIILGVPITDTVYAMIRRKLDHQPITSPDKMHLHHRLLALGFSHKGVVLTIYTISALFSFIALILYYASIVGAILLIVATLLGIEILVELIGLFGENRQPILYVLRFFGNRNYRKKILRRWMKRK
jgi:UDP-GlcNAc:undecaprenyl-phosphate GlcNAc-1-phosphate transferase